MILKSQDKRENIDLETIQNQIETIENEVRDFALLLKNTIGNNDEITNLLLGWKIFYSPVIINPKILFIGINPGRGNEESDKNLIETDQISYLDIYNDDYRDDYPNTYHLAEKTIKFFRLINWGDEKIKSVFEKKVLKTNFFNLATENINDLKTVINDIEFWDEYFKKSAYFSVQLINLLKPKVVILEGKTVFNNIVEQCYQKKVWSVNDFGYLYDDINNTHISSIIIYY